MVTFYYCTNEHDSLFWFTECPKCGAALAREIQCIPKGDGTKMLDGVPTIRVEEPYRLPRVKWRITVEDWDFLRVQKIKPECDRPVFGA